MRKKYILRWFTDSLVGVIRRKEEFNTLKELEERRTYLKELYGDKVHFIK